MEAVAAEMAHPSGANLVTFKAPESAEVSSSASGEALGRLQSLEQPGLYNQKQSLHVQLQNQT